MRFLFLLIYIFISGLVFGQDTLFVQNVHYDNYRKGVSYYLENGKNLTISFETTIGTPDVFVDKLINMNRGFETEAIGREISGNWNYTYQVFESGCYKVRFKPGGEIAYTGGNLSLLGKNLKLYSCKLLKNTQKVTRGDERILTPSEIRNTEWNSASVQVKKEIGDLGEEFCTARIHLNPGQKIKIGFDWQEGESRMDFLVYTENETFNATQFTDRQFGLTGIGFESQSGGDYIIQFEGRSVFKRTDDLKVWIGK